MTNCTRTLGLILVVVLAVCFFPSISLANDIPNEETHMCIPLRQYNALASVPTTVASVCALLVSYKNVWIPRPDPNIDLKESEYGDCQMKVENELLGLTQIGSIPDHNVSDFCKKTIFTAMCAKLYRPCTPPHSLSKPCKSLCLAVRGTKFGKGSTKPSVMGTQSASQEKQTNRGSTISRIKVQKVRHIPRGGDEETDSSPDHRRHDEIYDMLTIERNITPAYAHTFDYEHHNALTKQYEPVGDRDGMNNIHGDSDAASHYDHVDQVLNELLQTRTQNGETQIKDTFPLADGDDDTANANDDEDIGGVCTRSDIDILKNVVQFDLDAAFDCEDENVWSNDDAFPIVLIEGNASTAEALVRQNPDGFCVGNMHLDSAHVDYRCEPYTGSICSSVFRSQNRVFLRPGIGQYELEQRLHRFTVLYNLVPRSNPECTELITSYVCLTAFPACGPATAGVAHIPLPQYPNQQLCADVLDKCAEVLPIVGAIAPSFIPNCNERLQQNKCLQTEGWPFFLNSTTGEYGNYVFESQYIPGRSQGLSTSAPELYRSRETNLAPYLCEEPLVTVPNGDRPTIYGGRCAPPCPPIYYTESQYDDFDVFNTVFATISFVACVLCALTFGLIYQHKRHEQRYLLYYTVMKALFLFFLFLGVLVKETGKNSVDLMCKNDSEYYHMEGFALAQGIFCIFFYLCLNSLWFVCIVDVALKVLFNRQFNYSALRRKDALLTTYAILVPLFCILALLVSDQIGGNSGIGFSFGWITVGDNYKSAVEWIMFYVPILTNTLVGLGLLVAMWVRVFITQTYDKKLVKPESYRRFLITLFIVGFFKLFFFFIRVVIEARRSGWDAASEDYMFCLLIMKAGGFVPQCPYTDRPSAAIIYLVYLCIFIPALVLFVSFCLTSQPVLRAWGIRLLNLFRAEEKQERFRHVKWYDDSPFYLIEYDHTGRRVDGHSTDSTTGSMSTTEGDTRIISWLHVRHCHVRICGP